MSKKKTALTVEEPDDSPLRIFSATIIGIIHRIINLIQKGRTK